MGYLGGCHNKALSRPQQTLRTFSDTLRKTRINCDGLVEKVFRKQINVWRSFQLDITEVYPGLHVLLFSQAEPDAEIIIL